MKSWTITHCDFKMRIRRKNFIFICAFLLLSAYWFVPRREGISIEVISGYNPLSDPTWVPMSAAAAAALFLPIIGFLYVKNVVDTDRNTGMLNLVNTSAIGRLPYMFAKYFSSVLLLSCFLLIMIAGTLLMMTVHFPGKACSLFSFITPFLAVIPGLFFIAALSLLFETLSGNKRWKSWSNIFFVGIWITLLTLGVTPNISSSPIAQFVFRAFEFTGYGWQLDSIRQQIGTSGFSSGISFMQADPKLPRLAFKGLSLTTGYVTGKLLLIVCSFLLVVFSAILLPQRERAIQYHKSEVKHISKHRKPVISNCNETLGVRPVWTPVSATTQKTGKLIFEELSLLLRSQSFWGLMLITIVWILAFTIPLTFTQDILFPIIFGLGFPIFGELGCRVHHNGILDLFYTIDGAPVRQLFSQWVASIIISFVLAIPVIMRTIAIGSFIGVFACVVFALFVPAFAIFLGEYTGTERVFEVAFLIFIYLMLNSNKIYGISANAVSPNKVIILFVITAACLTLAWLKRIKYRNTVVSL